MINQTPLDDPWTLIHIITKLEIGGAQFSVFDTLEKTQIPFAEKFLLCGSGGALDPKSKLLSETNTIHVPFLTVQINPFKDLLALTKIFLFIRSQKKKTKNPRILVHTHCSKAGVLGRIAAFVAGVDIIIHTVHGYGYHLYPKKYLRPLFRFAEKLCGFMTHAFTTDSNANKIQGQRHGLFNNAPVQTIYCGINFEEYKKNTLSRTKVRESLNIALTSSVIIHITNFKSQKAPMDFFATANKILTSHPDTIFVVAGDGPEKQICIEYAQKHRISEKIRLLGWRNDISDLMHASDLLLNTSRWEGLPQAFPQALLSGIPIVATLVDGAEEIIISGHNGSLCPPGNIECIANKAIDWITRKNDYNIKTPEHEAMIEKFSNIYTTSQTDQLYASLTKERI